MSFRWEEKNALIQQKLLKEDNQGSRSLSHSQGGPSPATLNSQVVTFLVSSEVRGQELDILVNVNLKPNGVYVFAHYLPCRQATAREQVISNPWLRQCAVAMNLIFTWTDGKWLS